MASRGGRSNGSWQISRIVQNISWDAGLIVKQAFRGMHKPQKKTKRKPTEFVRFIYKGQFYRRPVVKRDNKRKPPELMKLPPAGPQVLPQPFRTPAPSQKAEALIESGGGRHGGNWSWRSWLKLNGPLLILNFGSFATLLGFTRCDVLELRSLAITGNISFVLYSLFITPIRWPAISWSALFAAVNGYNIVKILNERSDKAVLDQHEMEIYSEHFEDHNVTPVQFMKILSKGRVKVYSNGDVLSKRGEPLNSVKLVVSGSSRANFMGRRLTAMGSTKGNRDALEGGDSGAWVGEMAYLQSFWDRQNANRSIIPNKLKRKRDVPDQSMEEATYHSMSNIVAASDNLEVIEWTYDDLDALMRSSADMQGALTRAMTKAIVGKVINFLVSRQSIAPQLHWSAFLDFWKNSRPRRADIGDKDMEETLVSTR
mmetsp:Transcript_10157/g.23790  ORF Transcript_10157/g.23790 Transcript_10157/m.23790 type:complete len:427 (-) Transcript_10157:91-1371(-)